jgi:hypothetical protein
MLVSQINSFNSPQVEPSASLISQKVMKKEIWQHGLEVIRVDGFFIFPLPLSIHLKSLHPFKNSSGKTDQVLPSTATAGPAQHPNSSCIFHCPTAAKSADLSKDLLSQFSTFIHSCTILGDFLFSSVTRTTNPQSVRLYY